MSRNTARTVLDPDPDVYSPSEDWAEAALDGSLAPSEIAGRDTRPVVTRTFGFIDLCGFTATAETADPDQLVEMLWAFRLAVRRISAARGVRVAKWLGDGAMIIGLDPAAAVATCVDICARHYPLAARAGVTCGTAILFDGDDYVGRSPNLAARLCDAAPAGKVLAVVDDDQIPGWVAQTEIAMRQIRSVPDPVLVRVLEVANGVVVPPLASRSR